MLHVEARDDLCMQAMESSAKSAEAERQQLLDMAAPDPPITVAVLFGGCSSAPGLTLASARSLSHLLSTSAGTAPSSADAPPADGASGEKGSGEFA